MEEEFENKIREMAESEQLDSNSSISEQDKELLHILNTSKQWKAPVLQSNDKSWEELERMILTEKTSKSTRSYKFTLMAASVSVLIVSVLALLFINRGTVNVATGIAEQKTIQLPDSSMVFLSAQSSVTYSKNDFISNRELTLEGEAYFEVNKGSKFSVLTDKVTTTVLGTSFNIYARNNRQVVSCISGSVKVSDESSSIVLSRGETVSAISNELANTKKQINIDKTISWLRGKFYYHNEPFENVLLEMKIQFGISIEGADFGNRYYTGNFNTMNLNTALKQVLTPMGYSFVINNKVVTVH